MDFGAYALLDCCRRCYVRLPVLWSYLILAGLIRYTRNIEQSPEVF